MTNEHDLSKKKEVLYSETVVNALGRKSKSRKKPEIAKEMQSKKRRVYQTSQPLFQAGLSRKYGNRGGQTVYTFSKQGSQSNRKRVQSNCKISKKQRSRENRNDNYKWYSSWYGTNNKTYQV